MVCKSEEVGVVNKNICIPEEYNKFDLPLPDTVNFIDVGIDITDVLRINDKVCIFFSSHSSCISKSLHLEVSS
jgi:hypothetical protein